MIVVSLQYTSHNSFEETLMGWRFDCLNSKYLSSLLFYCDYRIRLSLVSLFQVQLCLVPMNLVVILVYENISTKNFMQKIISSNLLCIRSSYFFVFLFKYDEVIIKITSSCSFGKKFAKFWKVLKNKNQSCLVILTNLGKSWSFRGTRQRRIRYMRSFFSFSFIFSPSKNHEQWLLPFHC